MPFRILSIDGGGLRGIVPALVLKHVERLSGVKRVQNSFELLAGASTGALIAAGLTVADRNDPEKRSRLTVDDIVEVYRQRGKVIFPGTSRFFLARWKQWVMDLLNPKFGTDGLDVVLRSLLYEMDLYSPRLLDCNRPLFICSYDLATNSPLIFTSREAFEDPMRNVQVYDACRATSAGPTYLPPYRFALNHAHDRATTDRVTCIDGGVFMNNPAMGALVEVLEHQGGAYYDVPDLDLSDIYLLSIGTGHLPQRIAEGSQRWGRFGWSKCIFDVMMWGSSQVVDEQVRTALGLRARTGKLNYLRINVEIKDKKYSDMANSDAASLAHLEERVEEDFMQNAFIQDELLRFIADAEIRQEPIAGSVDEPVLPDA